MDLNSLLYRKKIESIGFDTVYTEKPVSNLVDFNWKRILDVPAANYSNATINELKLLSKLTRNRTSQDVEFIHTIDQDTDILFINLLTKYNIIYPKNYIDLFYDIVRPVLLNTKSFWNRPRPIQLAKLYNINIDLIITDTIHTASYPSGHTVYSSLVAHILKDIYPQIKQQQLDNVVSETAKARVLQGAHYPSDNMASLIFSKFIFDKLNNKLRKYYNEQI